MSDSEEEGEGGRVGGGAEDSSNRTSPTPRLLSSCERMRRCSSEASAARSPAPSLARSVHGNVHVCPRSRGNKRRGGAGGSPLPFFLLPFATPLVLTLCKRPGSVGSHPLCP